MFQGTVGSTDYYMGGSAGQRLTISGTLGVVLNDPAAGAVNATGLDNNGVFQDLPETVRSLDSQGAVLVSEGRGPASVIVGGAVWMHSDVGGASYDAYFGPASGQALYIEGGAVWLSDPGNNTNVSGTYAGGAFQFDGTSESVQAGDLGGVALPLTPQNRTQNTADNSTVQGNMDIFGNVVNLGTWQGDPTRAGMSLSFADQPPGGTSGAPSTISLVANRPLNQWMWSHATSTFTSTMPMMQLDPANRLTLYSPVDGTVQVVLDPVGTSTFHGTVSVQGPLHVQQRGDLTMGAFTNGPGQ
jgi:hypothetical protein